MYDHLDKSYIHISAVVLSNIHCQPLIKSCDRFTGFVWIKRQFI